MLIKGLQKTTLIDYPGKLACTLFVGGCNFRCGYCYNSDLVFNKDVEEIHLEEIFAFLDSRRRYLEGVCITGGEPTIYPGLADFCDRLKKMGYLVKLDTNGSNPHLLKKLISRKLVDYIAMDIKAGMENYSQVIDTKANQEKLKESISLIMDSGVEYEFRSTIIPDIFTDEEMKKISLLIKGAKKYYIQQFRPDSKSIAERYREMNPLPAEKLQEFKKIIEPMVKEVSIRND
ncbi:anaerobic ribonucleoside-triphosphate reductase activating protein [Candidatus Woesearchaeota archaeon]|nr:anaerobic ribonucleoside-triphosphate reductase activating protein [Candidatus Woesearchaeota archaeon]